MSQLFDGSERVKCPDSPTRKAENFLPNVYFILFILLPYPAYSCHQDTKPYNQNLRANCTSDHQSCPARHQPNDFWTISTNQPKQWGVDQTCQQTVPCLAHCLYWSISIVPALGVCLCQLPSMNNLSSALLLLLEPLNNHWPCQSCWAEPQELPNGLGLEPPMFPDAGEMRFSKALNSKEKEGWSLL